jgi:hypothetical protein
MYVAYAAVISHWYTFATLETITYLLSRTYACSIVHSSLRAQYLFGTGIGDVSQLTQSQVYERAVCGIATVQERYTALPLAPAESSRTGAGASNSADASSGTSAGGLVMPSGRDYARSSMGILDHGHLVNYGGKSLHVMTVVRYVILGCGLQIDTNTSGFCTATPCSKLPLNTMCS